MSYYPYTVDGSGIVDKDGCYHSDMDSFLLDAIFGFETSGSPRRALRNLHGGLALLAIRETMPTDAFDTACLAYFGSDAHRDLMWRVFDVRNLISFGVSIDWAWLTPQGKEALEMLTMHLPNDPLSPV